MKNTKTLNKSSKKFCKTQRNSKRNICRKTQKKYRRKRINSHNKYKKRYLGGMDDGGGGGGRLRRGLQWVQGEVRATREEEGTWGAAAAEAGRDILAGARKVGATAITPAQKAKWAAEAKAKNAAQTWTEAKMAAAAEAEEKARRLTLEKRAKIPMKPYDEDIDTLRYDVLKRSINNHGNVPVLLEDLQSDKTLTLKDGPTLIMRLLELEPAAGAAVPPEPVAGGTPPPEGMPPATAPAGTLPATAPAA